MPLGQYEFASEAFSGVIADGRSDVIYGNRFLGTWAAHMPVPLPRPYVEGIDFLKWEYERGMASYLRGQWKESGWWHYYIYCVLLKIPIPMLLFAFAAIVNVLVTRRLPVLPFECALLFGFPAAFMVALSLQHGLSHHLRYLLPAFPFFYVLVGKLATHVTQSSRIAKSFFIVLIFWLSTDAVFCHPHQISYFNELIGGPKNGHQHLLESNVDWGQDLYHLAHWLEEDSGRRPVTVDYYGFAAPDAFGVGVATDVFMETSGGTHLHRQMEGEKPFWLCVSVGRFEREDRYDFLQGRSPDDRIGYSILVYYIDPRQKALRR